MAEAIDLADRAEKGVQFLLSAYSSRRALAIALGMAPCTLMRNRLHLARAKTLQAIIDHAHAKGWRGEEPERWADRQGRWRLRVKVLVAYYRSAEELARVLGVSDRTVHSALRDGKVISHMTGTCIDALWARDSFADYAERLRNVPPDIMATAYLSARKAYQALTGVALTSR